MWGFGFGSKFSVFTRSKKLEALVRPTSKLQLHTLFLGTSSAFKKNIRLAQLLILSPQTCSTSKDDEVSPECLKLLAMLDEVERPEFRNIMDEAVSKLQAEDMKFRAEKKLKERVAGVGIGLGN